MVNNKVGRNLTVAVRRPREKAVVNNKVGRNSPVAVRRPREKAVVRNHAVLCNSRKEA